MDEEFRDIDQRGAWTAVYHEIGHSSGKYRFSYRDAKKIENNGYNRYRDVSPYDHSRIKLKRSNTDYINACLVKVSEANRAYILTQGPLRTTAGHFWLMIWEQNSKAILMLNRVVEKNICKCFQYWPENNEIVSNKLEFPDVGLEVTFLEQTNSTFVITKLLLTDTASQESRIILHFHYTSWPDFGVPESPSAFLNFHQVVKEHHVLDEDVGPAVIHCSAGIGRSGTFCLVDSCLLLCEKSGRSLEKGKIIQVLLDMRTYRMGLIQTPDQLRFSYLAILEGAKRFTKTRTVDIENNQMIENGHDIIPTSEGATDKIGVTQPLPKSILKNPDSSMFIHEPSQAVGTKDVIPEDGNEKICEKLNSSLNESLELRCSDSNIGNNIVQRTSSLDSPTNITSPDSSKYLVSCLPETSALEDRLSINSNNSKDSSLSAESAKDLRKRKRREKIENTNKKICEMKAKQRSSEAWLKRRRSNSDGS